MVTPEMLLFLAERMGWRYPGCDTAIEVKWNTDNTSLEDSKDLVIYL